MESLSKTSDARAIYTAFAGGVMTFPGDGFVLEKNAMVVGLPDHTYAPPEIESVVGKRRLDIRRTWFLQFCFVQPSCCGPNLVMELDDGIYATVCPTENNINWLRSFPDHYKPKGPVAP